MSDAAECVCGHDVSSHTRMHGKDCGCAALIDIPGGQVECPCCCCRSVVPWPTEPGAWWCDRYRVAMLAHLDPTLGEIVIAPDGFTNMKRQGTFAPAKFTKQIETNPFPKAPR